MSPTLSVKSVICNACIALLASTSFLELFSRFPLLSPVDQLDFQTIDKGSSLHLLFPGFGGPDANTRRIINNLSSRAEKNEKVVCYDWMKYRGNILRASFNGQSVGRILGKQLALNMDVNQLHCIGISVGSFAADACISEFTKIRKKMKLLEGSPKPSTDTRLTLLCPFQQRGLFDAGYGAKHFGKTSDFCEQFYIADDPGNF